MIEIAVAALLVGGAVGLVVRPSGRGLLLQRVRATPDQLGPSRGRRGTPSDRPAEHWSRSRRIARRRAASVEVCAAVADELRAGAMPATALAHATAAVPGVCDEAARTARLGGDVPAALRSAARRRGQAGLVGLATAWSVSDRSGAGLADACQRVADWLREDEALRREVAAQLAGPRATARLLAVLPVVGIALGSAMGARPLDVLLGTPYGLMCLVLGAGLAAAGVWWTERLARAVEERV